jgi:hypothetical protein
MRRRLNLLYLLGPAELSKWDNNELRYSIRSMSETNPVDSVTICGPWSPPFLKGFHYIHVDIGPKKFRNLLNQLLHAAMDPCLPEDLILMNDDFFMRKMPEWNWEPTFMGPVPAKPRNHWQRTVWNTGEWLKTRGIENPLSYEGHTPMPIEKTKMGITLRELIPAMDDKLAMQFRTAYGNLWNIGGNLHVNAKHRSLAAWPNDSPFLSTKGQPVQEIKDFITQTWPIKSRWEV